MPLKHTRLPVSPLAHSFYGVYSPENSFEYTGFTQVFNP